MAESAPAPAPVEPIKAPSTPETSSPRRVSAGKRLGRLGMASVMSLGIGVADRVDASADVSEDAGHHLVIEMGQQGGAEAADGPLVTSRTDESQPKTLEVTSTSTEEKTVVEESFINMKWARFFEANGGLEQFTDINQLHSITDRVIELQQNGNITIDSVRVDGMSSGEDDSPAHLGEGAGYGVENEKNKKLAEERRDACGFLIQVDMNERAPAAGVESVDVVKGEGHEVEKPEDLQSIREFKAAEDLSNEEFTEMVREMQRDQMPDNPDFEALMNQVIDPNRGCLVRTTYRETVTTQQAESMLLPGGHDRKQWSVVAPESPGDDFIKIRWAEDVGGDQVEIKEIMIMSMELGVLPEPVEIKQTEGSGRRTAEPLRDPKGQRELKGHFGKPKHNIRQPNENNRFRGPKGSAGVRNIRHRSGRR